MTSIEIFQKLNINKKISRTILPFVIFTVIAAFALENSLLGLTALIGLLIGAAVVYHAFENSFKKIPSETEKRYTLEYVEDLLQTKKKENPNKWLRISMRSFYFVFLVVGLFLYKEEINEGQFGLVFSKIGINLFVYLIFEVNLIVGAQQDEINTLKDLLTKEPVKTIKEWEETLKV